MLLLLPCWTYCQDKPGQFVNSPDVQQSRAYSHGVLVNRHDTRMMTSGIIGTDKSGNLVVTSPRLQIRQAFENIRAILTRAGAGIDDIIEIETFLVDTANFLDYALERRDFFSGRSVPPPISKTYYAKALINPNALVEIAVMANVPASAAKDTKPIFVTAVVRAKKGKAAELRRELIQNISLSRQEPGCLSYELFQGQDDPDVFTLHERWTSREAFTNHFQMPYMKALSSKSRDLIESSQIFVVDELGE